MAEALASGAVPERPELTLPEAEAALLRAELAQAAVYLEYGTGGSTLLACEASGRTVFSVESSADWAAKMAAWFAANPPAAALHLHPVDIGPTGSWGRPKDASGFEGWPGYALSVWDLPIFRQPDLVLIDGRFRPACLMTTALRTQKPVTVLFDDYANREDYHVVEELFRPVAFAGRLAKFEIAPFQLPPERLSWLIGLYLRPY